MIQMNGTVIQMEFGMMNSPTKDDQATSLNSSPAPQSSVAMIVKRIVLAHVIVQTTSPLINDVMQDLPC